ncbi:MAG: HDIG domain-containing protein [candidate division KSB1 bacterium]|nr:HDIG domain-containing protein [candidate division KSB1 bacterium]
MNILNRLKTLNEERRLFPETTRVSFREHRQKIVGIVLLAAAITAFFPRGKSFEFADLKEGQVYIGEEIIAPFTFPVLKSQEEYQNDVEAARRSVVPVFVRREDITKEQLLRLNHFFQSAEAAIKSRAATIDQLRVVFNSFQIAYSDQDLQFLLGMTPPSVSRGSELQRTAALRRIADAVTPLVQEKLTVGILDAGKPDLAGRDEVSVRVGDRETLESLKYVQDLAEAGANLLKALRNSGLTEEEVKIAYHVGSAFLKPNLLFDKIETESRIADRVGNVPLAKDQVLEGERIIDSHQRLTRQHLEKLHSLAVAKAERNEMAGFFSNAAPVLGKFLLVLALLTVLAVYLFREEEAIFNSEKKLGLIALNLLLLVIIAYLVNRFAVDPLVIPTAAFSMAVTIFFGARVGIMTTLVAALLLGAMRGNEYALVFVSLTTGMAAVQTVRKVRRRDWIIRSGLLTAGAYLATIIILSLVAYAPLGKFFRNASIGVLNGFLAPGLAYLMIIVFESMFDLTTDMTLLELSDFNHPLLRRLLLNAPGTYHHSYLVALLSEAAVEALGGNALLARVGALYHDVGKLEKSEYFIENQTSGRNPQEKLAPTMSALILANHVRKGLEIANEYGLPKELEAFIQQHHGTSLMSYFYQKALDMGTEAVSENEFRYPGPRPKTLETAVVMLADSVEAASRTLKDPPPNRVRNLIEQIIDERFKSGELDDSPLTLRDLSKIVNAFHKVLIGRFHGRVDYPSTINRENGKEQTQN